MEMPDLTISQCQSMKPVAATMAQQINAAKFDAYCVVGTSYPT